VIDSVVQQEQGTAHSAPSAMSSTAWMHALLYIAAVAMLLRFYALPLKPLHHDEGVNALFLVKLVEPPHVYKYDPANYHGPTLYYFGWLSALAVGLSVASMRAVTAVTGMLAVFALLALKRRLGAVGAISAALLFAVSPGAVYFSRYNIHEMLLVCFTLWAVVLTVTSPPRFRLLYLSGAAAAAGLAFATKETAIITAGGLLYPLGRHADSHLAATVPPAVFVRCCGRRRLGLRHQGNRDHHGGCDCHRRREQRYVRAATRGHA